MLRGILETEFIAESKVFSAVLLAYIVNIRFGKLYVIANLLKSGLHILL